MPEAKKAKLFGEICVEKGFITQEQLDTALEDQHVLAERGIKKTVGDILVAKGQLTPQQRNNALRLTRLKSGEAHIVAGYEVVSKLGAGGMGVVYAARSRQSGQQVALKVLPSHLAHDNEYVERFLREVAIMQELDHPNIVSCVDVGFDEDRGIYFCAMEYVEGQTLQELLERKGVVEEREALTITLQIAQATQDAYYRGLIHRDIKPGNIIITPEGVPKLLDLGLARDVSGEDVDLTLSGAFVGSPFYASPEQARGDRTLDIRTDIYSLGATLYHMVTGEPPFSGQSFAEILAKHLKEELPWPSNINPDVSERTSKLIEKMMAKDPADRHHTPQNVILDITAILADKPTMTEELGPGRSTINRGLTRRIKKHTEGPLPPLEELPDEVEAEHWPLYAAGVVIGLAVIVALVALLLGRNGGGSPDPQPRPAQWSIPAKPIFWSPPGAAMLLDFDSVKANVKGVSSPHTAEILSVGNDNTLVVTKNGGADARAAVMLQFAQPVDLSHFETLSFYGTAGPGSADILVALETGGQTLILEADRGGPNLTLGSGWKQYDLVLGGECSHVSGLFIGFNLDKQTAAYAFAVDHFIVHGRARR